MQAGFRLGPGAWAVSGFLFWACAGSGGLCWLRGSGRGEAGVEWLGAEPPRLAGLHGLGLLVRAVGVLAGSAPEPGRISRLGARVADSVVAPVTLATV
jgi:hypothetical protein